MSTPLTIVATIRALPGHETAVEKALLEAIAPTLAEPGCLQYDLHRDHHIRGLFLFFENWTTREAWEAHMQTPHLAALKTATTGKAEDTVIFQMEQLAP